MPNQLSFAVEFTKEQIDRLFSHPTAANLIVSGEYVHTGGGTWTMDAKAEVCDAGYVKIPGAQEQPSCIQPCPRG